MRCLLKSTVLCKGRRQAAIDGIIAGISGIEADAFARNIKLKMRLRRKLYRGGHGLGHGVGLATHDPGRRV